MGACTSSDAVDESAPVDPDDPVQGPELLRSEIDEMYRVLQEQKAAIEPLIYEKYGLKALLKEEQLRLMELLAKKGELEEQRRPLMQKCWERDAEEIYKAFKPQPGAFTADKSILISILGTRTKWQIAEIAKILETKYNVNLLEQVINQLTTTMGKIMTGSMTGLCKLFVYRILAQPERDAALLREFSDGNISLDDENFVEVACTRSNAQLKAAVEEYQKEFKKDLLAIVKTKSYKNYAEFMSRVLACKRDESNQPFDDETARKYADELYEACNGRTWAKPEPFIRIFSTINKAQYDSIADRYPDNELHDHISSKLGGAFALAVMTMCSDKYVYLAGRIEAAFKSYSPDKECLCRILGCVGRWECVKIREAYDRGGYGRTLVDAIKTFVKQQNYQNALLLLVEGDMSLTPMGSDREAGEDDAEATRDSMRAKAMAENMYRSTRAIDKGKQFLQEAEEHEIDDEEDGSYDFEWSGGAFDTLKKLKKQHKACEAANQAAWERREHLSQEIEAIKDMVFTIAGTCAETETLIRCYTLHVKSLKVFMERRDAMASKPVKKKILGL